MSVKVRTAVVGAVAAIALAGGAGAAPAFHPAQTPLEKALAAILKADADHPERVDPAVEGRGGTRPPVRPPAGAPYLKYLTTPLATAILVAEAGYVRQNCHGVYRSGDECGMDSDPIVCGQDFPDSYLFLTTQPGAAVAVVEAAWPPEGDEQLQPSGAYRLKLVGGVWKLDGVSCLIGGDSYNWKTK